MRLVCISDTHALHRELTVPDGDVLIHTGDLTRHGDPREVQDFDAWLAELPHRHKVVIAGNHDFLFEQEPERARNLLPHATYLFDQEVVLDGMVFYGSPWQPWFFDWAFNLKRGAPLRQVWDRIPARTDVLLTHGPPHGVLDQTARGAKVGCEELLIALQRVSPRAHIFGHIHEGHGEQVLDGIRCVNASSCNVRYEPVNRPIVVDL